MLWTIAWVTCVIARIWMGCKCLCGNNLLDMFIKCGHEVQLGG
jgi:hypothetical protein